MGAMQTIRLMLLLRRNGFRFIPRLTTPRHYIMQRGNVTIPIPRDEAIDKFTAADILRKAGLLAVTLMLAVLLSVAQPGESSGPEYSPSSTPRWLQ